MADRDSFSEAGRHGRKRKAGALISKKLKPNLAEQLIAFVDWKCRSFS